MILLLNHKTLQYQKYSYQCVSYASKYNNFICNYYLDIIQLLDEVEENI